jgi:ABC-2 type transport system ATP-binding protein
MSTIIATNLTKDYSRVRALAGVDLAVKEGEVFGFLGPNGAGKTTFIKILLGLVFPTAGGISVFGSPAGDTAARKKIGYLPENMRLQGFLKGSEFLDLSGKLYGLSRQVRKERTGRYLELLGLSAAAHRPLREYSKGMLQRIGIAQALMHNPDMLLLDEPTLSAPKRSGTLSLPKSGAERRSSLILTSFRRLNAPATAWRSSTTEKSSR